jgi:hypothetical protein
MGPYYDHQVGRFAPPDPVTDHDIIRARARRARAEATRDLLGAIGRGLKAAVRGVATLGDVRHRRPARLTGGCN